MPPLRVISGAKPPLPKLIERRSTYGGYSEALGGIWGEFRRQIQPIRRPALSGNDEMVPGRVTLEEVTHP